MPARFSSLTAGLRAFRSTFSQQPSSSLLRNAASKRAQSTASDAAAPQQSGFAKIWNSPVGPKTVHFWAPIMKWGMVLAGVKDFTRPAESISLQQNLALMATGLIWTRWCFVIRPQNMFLALVNFFVFCTGATQVTRVMMWRSSQAEQQGKDNVDVEAAKKEANA